MRNTAIPVLQKENTTKTGGNFDQPNVMPRLFAITGKEGWNEMFWDKDKAQQKIDTEYKKDFPNEEFYVEEINVS